MTARLITLDIETYRTRNAAAIERITAEALAKEPAKSAAKAAKEEWETEAARKARVEEALGKTALDPMMAEVLTVCVKLDDRKVQIFDGASPGCSEINMLGCVAEFLNAAAGPQSIWVGHNIEGFDLPVLLGRWLAHGIRPPRHFPTYKANRWRGWTFDTMLRCPSRTPFVSLNDACAMFDLGGKSGTCPACGEPLDGSHVAHMFEQGFAEQIMSYCAADVETEYALYNALTLNDTWGTYGLDDQVGAQIAEIEANPSLSEGTRAVSILNVLRGAGLVPKAA